VVSATSVMIPQLIEELSGDLVAVGENEYDPLFVVFLPQLSKAKVLKLRY
jgi:hypothetical protein